MFCFFCLNLGWRNFDDEHVSSLSVDKELVRSDAYVLFYRHRHLTVPFVFNEQNPSPMSVDSYQSSEETVVMESSNLKDIQDLIR